jgi:hypothetical protein
MTEVGLSRWEVNFIVSNWVTHPASFERNGKLWAKDLVLAA